MTLSVLNVTTQAAGSNAGTFTVTVPSTTAGSVFVLVYVCGNNNATLSSISAGGGTFTSKQTDGGGTSSWWLGSGVTAGTTSVVLTLSTSDAPTVAVYEIAGASTTVDVTATVKDTASGTTITSNTLTTTNAADIIIGAIVGFPISGGTITVTPTSASYTNQSLVSNAAAFHTFVQTGYQIVSSTATFGYNATTSTSAGSTVYVLSIESSSTVNATVATTPTPGRGVGTTSNVTADAAIATGMAPGRGVGTTSTVSTGTDATVTDSPSPGRAVAMATTVTADAAITTRPSPGRAVATHSSVATTSLPGVPFLDLYIAGYSLVLYAGFGVDASTDPAGWDLTDITTELYQPDPEGDTPTPAMNIVRGRQDEQGVTQSSSCTGTLKNSDGDFTPRRVQSAAYPYMTVGLPIQVIVATAVDTFERFSGTITDLDPRWDETGNAAFVDFTAHGVLERLTLDDTPALSATFRATRAGLPDFHWPMEEAAGAVFAAEINGGPSLRGDGITFGADGGGGSAASIDFTTGGLMSVGASTGSGQPWRIGFIIQPRLAVNVDSARPFTWTTGDGTTWALALFPTLFAPGGGQLEYRSADQSVTLTTSVNTDGNIQQTDIYDGNFHSIIVEGYQHGSNVAAVVYVDQYPVQFIADAAGTSRTLFPITSVRPNFHRSGVEVSTFSAAHLFIQTLTGATYPTSGASTFPIGDAAFGWIGEDPITRWLRLCAELGIPADSDAATDGKAMGAQTVQPDLALLRECELVDGGVMEDGINFGLYFHTLAGRCNGDAVMTPTLQQLDHRIAPVESNLLRANRATVSRPNGSTVTYTQPAGMPYAPTGPGGIGILPATGTFNVEDDAALLNYASWLVRLGTVDADRYPTLPFNFAARTSLIPSWLACGNGSRIVVDSNYSTGGEPPDVLVEGWTEGLSRLVWSLVANCSPSASAVIAAYGVDLYDSTTSSLAVGYTAGDTTMSVATTTTPLWVTGAVSFDINVGGLAFTVSHITGASSPQTLTVSGPNNGPDKNIAVGMKVSLLNTPYYAH